MAKSTLSFPLKILQKSKKNYPDAGRTLPKIYVSQSRPFIYPHRPLYIVKSNISIIDQTSETSISLLNFESIRCLDSVCEPMVQRSSDATIAFSFFDAPAPRTSDRVFSVDPATVGRSLARPARPFGQSMQRHEKVRSINSNFIGGSISNDQKDWSLPTYC